MSAHNLRRLPICASRWVDLRTDPVRHPLRRNRIRQSCWTGRTTCRLRFSKFIIFGSTAVERWDRPRHSHQPYRLIRYTLPRASSLAETKDNPSFLPRAPDITPLAL